ncbi:uncharacterized protein LOC112559075 [Pomacea canaliculata]|uniref:uncharacterized protein LOC112559075 n=1 Tax=Pomacea canaliculata TaxID=400727 RepID=UPI000D72AF54|nr:uncharacterized protein LOC112559075 [Pomacea canaliculata]
MRTIKVWKKVLAGVIMVFLAYGPTPLCGQEAVDEQTPYRQHGDLLTSFSLKWAATPTTDSAGQATFDPWSLSSSVQSDESTAALQSSILRKLLTEEDVRRLEDLLPGSDGTCKGFSRSEKTVIGCLVIAGISPSFANVVRHLYNTLVKSGYHEQSSPPEGLRRRRAARNDLPETSGNQREDPKSLVILRLVVKVDSRAVSIETTQDRLRNLTAEELESLLFLPVISSLEESRLSSGLDIETMSLFSEKLVQSEHSSASSVISVLPTVPPPPDFQSSRKSSFPDLSPSILPSEALSALPILTSSTLSSLSPTQTYFVISSTDEDYDVGSATILFDSGMAEGSASTQRPVSSSVLVWSQPRRTVTWKPHQILLQEFKTH